jgi:hypothetical protein
MHREEANPEPAELLNNLEKMPRVSRQPIAGPNEYSVELVLRRVLEHAIQVRTPDPGSVNAVVNVLGDNLVATEYGEFAQFRSLGFRVQVSD